MKALVKGTETTKDTLLERLAKKVEPSDTQLKEADKLPAHSRKARLILAAVAIPQLNGKLLTATIPGPLEHRSTGVSIMMRDNEPMVFFTDGSLRHSGGRLKSKKVRKALKRARRCAS